MVARQLQIETTREGTKANLRLTGELDLDTSGDLTAAFDQVAGQHEMVVVDVAQLSFLDSSGLRTLLYGRTAVSNAGGSFSVTGAGGAVLRVLDMTGTRALLSGT